MFNTEKLSIEQFNDIKQKLTKILEDASLVKDANEDNPDFNIMEFLKQTLKQYLVYQNSLFNYDLSDIPFEAWKDFYFITLEDLREDGLDIDVDINIDFSKTRANLDFSLVGINGKGNFKNCNVKNIMELGKYIDVESFDEDIISNYENYILSSSFSLDFKEKYYNHKLKIDDLVNLNDEQLNEFEQKKFAYNLKYYNGYEILGFKRFIELYKYSVEDFNEVLENLNYSLYMSEEENKSSPYYSQLFTCDLKDLKKISFEYFRETLLTSRFKIDYNYDYPKRLVEANKDIFLIEFDDDINYEKFTKGIISKEEYFNLSRLGSSYYRKSLDVDDLYNFSDYIDIFQNTDLTSFFSMFSFNIQELYKKIGNENFRYIIKNHKELLKCDDFLFRKFNSFWRDFSDKETSYANALRNTLIYVPEIYDVFIKNSPIPEWFNNFNFKIVDSYTNIDEMNNFDNQTFVMDFFQTGVLCTFGKENILNFHKNTNYFNDDFDDKILKFYKGILDRDFLNNYDGKIINIYDFLLKLGEYSELNSFSFDLLQKELPEKKIQYLSFLKDNNYSDDYKGLTDDEIEVCFDNNGANLSNLYELLFFKGKFEKLLQQKVNLSEYGFDAKKLKVLDVYKNIEQSAKSCYKEYIINNLDYVDIEKIDLVSDVIVKLSTSNSIEMFKFRDSLTTQLLNTNDPIINLQKVEEVFIKNNLPTVGKIYNVFQILHPDCEGFDFSDSSNISPVLQSKSVKGRNAIIFADLLKASFGSNNRSVKDYLDNIEQGDSLFRQISSNQIIYEQLDDKNKQILSVFLQHLNTLYNNTKLNKSNDFVLTGNIIDDINVFRELFSKDGSIDYDLPDRIVRMFGYFAGFDNFNDAKEYFNLKTKNADLKNRDFSSKSITLDQGDYIKGITDIKYLSNILQNGSVAKEFLGDSAASDLTPLDTDLSKIMVKGGSIDDTISKTEANGYGSILFVLKNDDRFSVTRVGSNESNEMIDTKYDSSKLEIFYTGAVGNGHYGIRTGFASSEIDYMIVNQVDHRVNLEIVKNGFYIPIVDRKSGKLIFTPEDYDKLRSKMSGLSYYGNNDYFFSDKLLTPDIKELSSQISDSEKDILKKRTAINNVIREAISSIGLELKTSIDGDLTPGSIELIDTGSTGRGTNMPGDGDFDFMIRVDKVLLENPYKFNQLKNVLLNKFKDNNNSLITGNGDFRLKGVQVSGLEVPVDIDISFVQKTNKLNYSTDMSLRDRLDTIRKQDPEKYNLVVANILLAKKTLKEAGVYKPNRGEVPQGGLGGVGIENWILQNGGSFEDAARSFIECANGKSFEEFKNEYFIWDFGENHFAVRNGDYPHDNFVANNMSEAGYKKMQEVLKNYLNKLNMSKQSENINYMIEAMANGLIDTDGNYIVSSEEVNINKMGFGTLTVLCIFSLLASCLILVLGVLLKL